MVTTLHFLYPFFVMLIGFIFFKEHISNAKKIILLIATIGIFLFLDISGLNGQERVMHGIFISILSAITYALYMSGVDNLGLKNINNLKLTFYFSLFASITCFIYANVTNTFTVLKWKQWVSFFSYIHITTRYKSFRCFYCCNFLYVWTCYGGYWWFLFLKWAFYFNEDNWLYHYSCVGNSIINIK